MDARVINFASVLGNLSDDRYYLRCTYAEYSEPILTSTILVGGGIHRLDNIVKKNNRNYTKTGERVGLFGASPVFFALCSNREKSMRTNERVSLRSNRDAALNSDGGTVSRPNNNASYRREGRRAA